MTPVKTQSRDLALQLIDRFQKNFPLVSRPFLVVAHKLGIEEEKVLQLAKKLKEEKIISRIGPVFTPGSIGSSSLCAMRVPQEQLDTVADFVSAMDEINHNYERENDINLWFVITASSEENLRNAMTRIEDHTGIAVLDLRLEKEYKIDLGFNLDELKNVGLAGEKWTD